MVKVADAIKLLLKEYVAPTQADIILFFLGPVITLIFGLLGFGVLPTIRIEGLTIAEMLITINLFFWTYSSFYLYYLYCNFVFLSIITIRVGWETFRNNKYYQYLVAPECIAAFATPISNLSAILFIIPYDKGNREIISQVNPERSSGKLGAYANKVTQTIRVCEMRKALFHKRVEPEKNVWFWI